MKDSVRIDLPDGMSFTGGNEDGSIFSVNSGPRGKEGRLCG